LSRRFPFFGSNRAERIGVAVPAIYQLQLSGLGDGGRIVSLRLKLQLKPTLSGSEFIRQKHNSASHVAEGSPGKAWLSNFFRSLASSSILSTPF